jgi:hypothetical protein
MLPYNMFDVSRSADEARRADRLENIYHKGQSYAWNGREMLTQLIQKHGKIQMEERPKQALGRIFSILMWGELAAWKISAQLADKLIPLEAKMAATSQAFDEARHFYVLHDYLEALGAVPSQPDPHTQKVLDMVLETDEIPEKLQGMQLIVENIALTIFHFVRRLKIEPVLSELLPYYEKDEARHVGLGIQALPQFLRVMSLPRRIKFTAFQVQIISHVLRGLKSLEPDLAVLGISARDVLEDGVGKIEREIERLMQEGSLPNTFIGEFVRRSMAAVCEISFPREENRPITKRMEDVYTTLRYGPEHDGVARRMHDVQ